jgi:hypothetical protein
MFMEVKIINLGKSDTNTAVKIFTKRSDICVVSNINDLSKKGKNELYNSKWIINCTTLDDFNTVIELAKELRPKQVFVMDISGQLDEFPREEIKSWRGKILKEDDLLELKDKPDEGIFLNDCSWVAEDGRVTSFQLKERFRIEGRIFVLCTGVLAYGKLKIGTVSETDNKEFQYEVDKFELFDEPILLVGIPDDEQGLFVDNIENYYFDDKLKSLSDQELVTLCEKDKIVEDSQKRRLEEL